MVIIPIVVVLIGGLVIIPIVVIITILTHERVALEKMTAHGAAD